MTYQMPDTMPNPDEAWAAVLQRDRSFDGRFVTGVMTTGIYCRPSCAARHPLRANVRFFADGATARGEGLRPCKRCLPDDIARDETAVMATIVAIRDAGQPLALTDLAERTGYSPSHFQRLFKRQTGLSPAAFARALMAERAEAALGEEARVTDAIYAAGYSAPSRFYVAMNRKLGMAPSAWRNGGAGETIAWTVAETSLGRMLLAATDKGICRLSFNEGREVLEARFPRATLVEDGPAVARIREATVNAIEHPGEAPDLPLDVDGTAFQQAVWAALRQIPPGETRSYAEIAAAVGKPGAVRAAGSANGANNVAVLIPCHRVIRSDGTLGGYAYGLEIKRELLEREKK